MGLLRVIFLFLWVVHCTVIGDIPPAHCVFCSFVYNDEREVVFVIFAHWIVSAPVGLTRTLQHRTGGRNMHGQLDGPLSCHVCSIAPPIKRETLKN